VQDSKKKKKNKKNKKKKIKAYRSNLERDIGKLQEEKMKQMRCRKNQSEEDKHAHRPLTFGRTGTIGLWRPAGARDVPYEKQGQLKRTG